MQQLFVCPKINGLDPSSKEFDGGGHTMSIAEVAPRCHSHMAEGDRTCDELLVPASEAWRQFVGVQDLPAAAEAVSPSIRTPEPEQDGTESAS